MAISNFLSGGFYKKVGHLVGQRWRNKRTVHDYVVPKDPKSPAQLKERSRFSESVYYTEVATWSGSGASWFKFGDNNIWNNRMKRASELISQYNTFLSRLPLTTEQAQPPFIISQVNASYLPVSHQLSVNIYGELPPNARRYGLFITNNPETKNIDEVFFVETETQFLATEPIIFQLPVQYVFDPSCRLRVVSLDDTDSATDQVISPELPPLPIGPVVTQFDYSIKNFSTLYEEIQITFNQPYLSATTQVRLEDAYLDNIGTFKHMKNFQTFVSNDGGYVKVVLRATGTQKEQLFANAEGSTITFKKLQTQNLSQKAIAENVTIPLPAPQYRTAGSYLFMTVAQIQNNQFFCDVDISGIDFVSLEGGFVLPTLFNFLEKRTKWEFKAMSVENNIAHIVFSPEVPEGKPIKEVGGWCPKWGMEWDREANLTFVDRYDIHWQLGLVGFTTDWAGKFNWSFEPSYSICQNALAQFSLESDCAKVGASGFSSSGIIAQYFDNEFGLLSERKTGGGALFVTPNQKMGLCFGSDTPYIPVQMYCDANISDFTLSSSDCTIHFKGQNNVPIKNEVTEINLWQTAGGSTGKLFGVSSAYLVSPVVIGNNDYYANMLAVQFQAVQVQRENTKVRAVTTFQNIEEGFKLVNIEISSDTGNQTILPVQNSGDCSASAYGFYVRFNIEGQQWKQAIESGSLSGIRSWTANFETKQVTGGNWGAKLQITNGRDSVTYNIFSQAGSVSFAPTGTSRSARPLLE